MAEPTSDEARVAATEATLRAACEEAGILITADGRVSEAAAGELLGYSPGSLRNMRQSLVGPPGYHRAAGPGSRYSYRLIDLAVWIESGREESLELHSTSSDRT